MSIYKTSKAKASLAEITERFLAKLPSKGKGHTVSTSFGDTYCLELGDPSLPKLVVFHGGYTNHAFILYYLRSLIGQFHIFAFDMPGHPGKSSETVIDPRDNSYGVWACEAIEAVGLTRATLLGLSYGGFVSQRVAALKPKLVENLVLIVPAGVCGMNQLSLIRHLMLPQLLFGLTHRDSFLMAMMDALFTDYDDELVVDFFRDMLLYVKNDSRQMRLSDAKEFESFEQPVLLMTAENDVVFDFKKQAQQAKNLFKNLTVFELKGSKHSPSVTESKRNEVCNHIKDFILRADKG